MNTSLSNHYQNIEFFKYLCQSIKRDGVDALLLWLEDTDFFYAPASTRHHEAYKGGLVEHSLRVYFELCRLRDIFPDVKITDESIIITSLFHDLCKANFYVESKRNVKVDGKWKEVPYYTIDEQYKFGGHGSKSVYLIERFIPLTRSEAAAINTHMGVQGNDYSCYDVYREYPLAMLLHTADMIATCPKLRMFNE